MRTHQNEFIGGQEASILSYIFQTQCVRDCVNPRLVRKCDLNHTAGKPWSEQPNEQRPRRCRIAAVPLFELVGDTHALPL